MEQIIDAVQAFVWGAPMLLLLIGTGIFFTVRLGFFQVRHFALWMKKTLLACLSGSAKECTDGGAISPFATMCTALAAAIGTGNIAGVATALVFGGPGSIFWMWISSFFGMMTGFAENVLGMRYRVRDETGAWRGGPMYYLEKGLGSKGLACLFSLFCILASFGIGNMSQCNSIAGALTESFGVDARITGVATAVLLGIALAGGLKRIAKITETLVPVMGFFFVAGSLLVIFFRREAVPEAFRQIIRYAFGWRAGVGGVAGYTVMRAMRDGIARGVFSHEAGLGSSVIVHASGEVKEPCEQGMWSVFEVFVDTIVLCTLTAVVILVSGVYNPVAYEAALVEGTLSSLPNGGTLTVLAFSTVFGRFGGVFVSVSLVLFAFATLLGWSMYGERAVCYLFGSRTLGIYKLLFVLATILGCTMQLSVVWKLSDTFNGLMAVPNLIGLLVLSGEVFDAWKSYKKRNLSGRKLSKRTEIKAQR